ncbi:MAG TPA: carboxypeptidase-like regulatory domain-containing protein, partial [Vicinamibacterales bacterium]|nr:carboxypeptidase-like regulatory domain-containing protein [Vicinamibacterales bacterium]
MITLSSLVPRLRVPVSAIAFAALLVPAASVAGQVADAVIEIVAVDQSGAALPGVTVTVSRPETGFQQAAVTDAVGFARALALPPGAYEIKLE